MINLNGNLLDSTQVSLENNRAFLYGDAVFETIKTYNGEILFLEDHYFRLMASMRILRMEIPSNFTMEFLEEEIKKTIHAHYNLEASSRVRITCYRTTGGKYLPEDRAIEYMITAEKAPSVEYEFYTSDYEIDLYKDFYISKQLLSTLKTTNRLINITASIYASENDYDNVFLLNDEKNIVEAINGNVYIVSGKQIITPPVADGCINGVLRKNLKSIVEKRDDLEWIERSISPFELQKADEMWISNVIQGIICVSKYRKKEYNSNIAQLLIQDLNTYIQNKN